MKEETKAKMKDIFEWIYCIVIAVVIALLIKYFLGTPTVVKQTSMVPTLKQNERLLLNRITRTLKKEPKRGEIVTFEAPSKMSYKADEVNKDNPVAEYKNEPNGIMAKFLYHVVEIAKTSYIERVIGLPGDHVEIKDGKVYLNGEEYHEGYLADDVITTDLEGLFTDVVVPEGTVFVMGDNREHSADSRRFGCIPIEKLEGTVSIRIWPLNKFGKVY